MVGKVKHKCMKQEIASTCTAKTTVRYSGMTMNFCKLGGGGADASPVNRDNLNVLKPDTLHGSCKCHFMGGGGLESDWDGSNPQSLPV